MLQGLLYEVPGSRVWGALVVVGSFFRAVGLGTKPQMTVSLGCWG